MLSQQLLRKLARAVLAIFALASSVAQSAPQQKAPAKSSIPGPQLSEFLPERAVLARELPVTFEPGGGSWIVLAYAVPDQRTPHFLHCGVRILEYKGVSGWAVEYDETNLVISGAGPSGAIRIEKVRGSTGSEALVVVLEYSGAGTATDWHIVAPVDGKFVKLDSAPIRDRILKDRQYEFMGYNSVSVKGDLVIEFVPGYSPGRARCCPDRPSLEIESEFTGSSIKLHSVKEVPLIPQDQAPRTRGAIS